jgi:hypothetical protein
MKNTVCILSANRVQKGLNLPENAEKRKVLEIVKKGWYILFHQCAPVAQLDRVSGYEPYPRLNKIKQLSFACLHFVCNLCFLNHRFILFKKEQ